MKKLKQIIFIALLAVGYFCSIAYSATLQGYQGGTGIATTTASNVGKALTVSTDSPFLTYTFTSLGAGGGLATSTTGQYTAGNLFFVANSSTASASDNLRYTTSTGAFAITATSTFTGQLNFGSASGTNVSVSGYGLFPLLAYTSATGTTLFNTTASSTNLGFTNATGTRLSVDNVTSTILTISGITGSTQCLRVDTNGLVSGTGAACGTGNGNVITTAANTIAGYFPIWTTSASTTLSATSSIFWDSANLRVGIGTAQPSSTLHVVGSLQIPTNQTLSLGGQVSVKTTSSTFNYHNGTNEFALNPVQCSNSAFTIANVTSTSSQYDFWYPVATSTITRLTARNGNASGTMDFNIIWHANGSTASSSQSHLFNGSGQVGNVTSSATTSLDIFPSLVSFASTTVKANDVVQIITGPRASSTQWTFGICWKEIP